MLPYAGPSTPRPSSRIWRFLAIFCVAGIVLFGAGAIYLSQQPSGANRETANRVRCSVNLKALGQAIEQYAAAHDRRLPDSLTSFVRATPSFEPAWLVCESGHARVAPNVEALLRSLSDPLTRARYCSYLYLGDTLVSDQLDHDVLLICEPLENHEDASNVLLGNFDRDLMVARGSSRRGSVTPMDHAYSQIAAGVRPVRVGTPAATRPAAQQIR